ncbi:unnamed protein product [Rhizoctonia solani]|uniref:Laminin domain protein n=1 Tax=Rhizoctonia solani TaxID=456999 RepID=A0A8H3GM16_9AGAM|nr:unnamed protein product [Rhizoctonia solani]
MLTQPSQVPRINEYVYTPPALPAHLSSVYGLKPIVGQPTDEQVKAIHAVIGAVDAGSRVPNLYGPDLSLQLSQHLFSVQMAVYRRKYPVNVFPGDNTYSPPSLPAYVPVELESVVGAPSKEQLRAAQHAMRAVESLGNGESLQIASTADTNHHSRPVFAQYIQDSTFGEFVPKYGESQRVPAGTQESFNPPETPKTDEHEPVPTEQPVNLESRATTAIIEQGQVMSDIKELMGESKGVLENMNRVMIAMQRNQTTASPKTLKQGWALNVY